MRIAFIGKGGSGKTSICATFISWLDQQNKEILAIDADLNMHLAETLSIEHSQTSLSQAHDQIISQLTSMRESEEDFYHTSIPQDDEWLNLMKDEILQPYLTVRDNLKLCHIGSYQNEDVSAYSCYHTKLTVLEALLHRSDDKDNEYIVIDATAGIDTVATTLFLAYDLHVVVVEPTRKSVEVAKRYIELCKEYEQRFVLVANKVENENDSTFLASNFQEVECEFKHSSLLKELEQGDETALSQFVEQNRENCQSIANALPDNKVRGNYFDKLARSHEIVLDYYTSADNERKEDLKV